MGARLSSIGRLDWFLFFLFIPFYLWGFLGGHKQTILSINTDHAFTGLAFLGASVIWLRNLPSKVYLFFIFFLAFAIVQFWGVDLADVWNVSYVIFASLVYLFLAISYSIFFRDKVDLLVGATIACAAFSYFVVIVSWLTLGGSSWGRITIPTYVWSEGRFFYYPYGYEGSSDVNVLAYFMYSGLLAGWILWSPSRIWVKSVFLTSGALACVLTVSRSGAIAFLFVLFLAFFAHFAKTLLSRKMSVISIVRHGLYFIFSIFVVFLLVVSENSLKTQIQERITEGSKASNQDRFERLQIAFSTILDSDFSTLLLGNGTGFSRINMDPHNFYLSTLIDHGLVGLILFLIPLIFLISFIPRFFSGDRIARYLICFGLFFAVASLFYWQFRFYYHFCFWFFVAILAAGDYKGLSSPAR